MYSIKKIKENELNYIKLMNSSNKSNAKICLDQGASLQELIINNQPVIQDLAPLTYSDTYASAILFPFANRIKDGAYTFNQAEYQLEVNQKEENNAIHGLVYNKTFKLLKQKARENEASITLGYDEANESVGFPYTYSIKLEYTLTKDTLKLNVWVKNTDSKPFPFTLGWHPYFISKDLYQSSLKFGSNKKLVLGERMITTGVEDFINEDELEIKDKQLDDCFILNTDKIEFNTPDYMLEMIASSNQIFLQTYTPARANTIAIEPTTGVSDSFNNKIGLQVLDPGKSYSLDWEVKIKINNVS